MFSSKSKEGGVTLCCPILLTGCYLQEGNFSFNSSLYKPIYYKVYPVEQFHVRLSRDYMYMHTFTQTWTLCFSRWLCIIINCKEVLNSALGNIKNTWFGLNIYCSDGIYKRIRHTFSKLFSFLFLRFRALQNALFILREFETYRLHS